MGPSLRLGSHRNKVKTDFSLNDKSTTDDIMFVLILSADCVLTFKCPIGNNLHCPCDSCRMTSL